MASYLTETGLNTLVTKIKGLFASHTTNTSNPHEVTKTQLGLGSVENKSSETIRNEITSENIISALGYTPSSEKDNSDTKNTTGATDTANKIYLVGALAQEENPVTYSHDTVYIGADGCLYSNGVKVSDVNHTHNYAGSSSAGGAANSANKLNTNAGSATQPVYFKDGKPVATTYTLGKSVPSNAVFTDTTYSNFVKSGSEAKAGLVPAPSTTAGTTKYLREDGTWVVPPNTKYSNMTAATSSAAGKAGLVPAPAAGKQASFLRGDGTWVVPTDTKYTHPSYTARTGKPTANQTPAFGGTATVSQITSDAKGHVTAATDRTITIPSTLSNGTGTAGLIKTTSTVTSNSGYTACPVISGVPYYKDTNTTYKSLKNPYSLTIQGNGTTLTNGTYDGSAAKTVNITPSAIGAAKSNHTHSYLPLTGGTLTADSDNSIYGKAALNIENKTSASKTIFPSISFMQIGISDANLAMKNSNFYRTTSASDDYYKVYDEGNMSNPIMSGAMMHASRVGSTGSYSFVWGGLDNTASGNSCTAIGAGNKASGPFSTAIGANNTASADSSVAMSANNTASAACSVAMGSTNTASGYSSVAIGANNTASNERSVAMGSANNALGYASIAMGNGNTAKDESSVAIGNFAYAGGKGQTVLGHCNTTSLTGSTTGTSGDAFILGNGTTTTKSNAFRITFAGLTYAKGAYSSTGADYAEYFEWEDGNPNNEDRRGLFVTFANENKIRIATETDQYILGVVSAKPVIIGNTDDDDQWARRFLKDEYGEFIMQEFEQEREIKVIDTETGEEKTEIVTEIVKSYVENPEYDPSKEYATREQRPEWSPIGMLGVLSVHDDGTCKVNEYCKCSANGIATYCNEYTLTSYRVIERVSENIIKIVVK